jgi:hypothetical protein
MIILKEQIEPQTIKFIPREYSADTLIIKNETTNTFELYNPTFEIEGYYLKCDLVLDLKEDNFYTLTVIKNALPFTADNTIITVDNNILTADMTQLSIDNLIVYKDKIFCTNQNTNVFSVNADKYVSHATTNEYIVYE